MGDALQVFAFSQEEEAKCPGCNYSTQTLYVLDECFDMAKMKMDIGEADPLCGNCLAETLAEIDRFTIIEHATNMEEAST